MYRSLSENTLDSLIDTLKLLIRKPQEDDELLEAIIRLAVDDFEAMTGTEAEYCPDNILLRMAVVKYNLLGSEGLTSQNYNGLSESYAYYDAALTKAINRFRRMRTVPTIIPSRFGEKDNF